MLAWLCLLLTVNEIMKIWLLRAVWYMQLLTTAFLSVPGVLLVWQTEGQGATVLIVGAGKQFFFLFFFLLFFCFFWGGGYFSLANHFSFLSLSFLKTAGYRLKYCLKEPLNQNQSISQYCSLFGG